MVKEAYIRIPDSVFYDKWVRPDYINYESLMGGWLVTPEYQFSSYAQPINFFGGPYDHHRVCEIGQIFSLKTLGNSNVRIPHLMLTQKGGGQRSGMNYEGFLDFCEKSSDPIGYLGYKDALLERHTEEELVRLGIPTSAVVGIVRLNPSRLCDFVYNLWIDNKRIAEEQVAQIKKIQYYGDVPALMYRHAGLNFRMMMDVFNKSGSWEDAKEIVDRLRLVFSNWEKVDEASFQNQVQGRYQTEVSNNESILEMYIAYCNWFDAYFSSRFDGHRFFPAHPVDTDMLGMVCDFEYEKRDKLTSLSPVASKIKKSVLNSI